MSRYNEMLPPLLLGEKLKKKLTVLPEYDDSIRSMSSETRLIKLMDLYKLFVPQEMATEIYHKLYMMTAMSLSQKETKEATENMNAVHMWQGNGEFNGVITGATSSTIIGSSGIGKTTCIQKAVKLLGPVMESEQPLRKIIPVVIVSCPFDSSYKGLLYQILLAIDGILGSEYYAKAQKSNMNAQQVLGLVCQLCHLFIGTLVIDEIQFIVQHKSGTQLYRMILQLINASGISVVLVGTEECLSYFTQAPQMARRTTGLRYGLLKYETEFKELCQMLFTYQYVTERTSLSEGLQSWLFEHTAGSPANLIALFHDAQEIAILKGYEKINLTALTEAYSARLAMLHEYIEPKQIKLPQKKKKKPLSDVINNLVEDVKQKENISVAELQKQSKTSGINIIMLLFQYYAVTEVTI